jgi:predicted hydrocarbon binding protein
MKDYEVKLKLKVFGHEIIIRKALPVKEVLKRVKKEQGRAKGWRMCPTMAKRMMTREQAVEQRDKKPEYLRVYMCEFCNTWHLTHKRNK